MRNLSDTADRLIGIASTIGLDILFCLPGCASFFDNGNDIYDWSPKREYAAEAYEWIHIPDAHTRAAQCGVDTRGNAPVACAIRVRDHVSGKPFCTVFAAITEDEAKKARYYGSKYTLFEHEVWNADKTIGHCAGFNHGLAVYDVLTGKKS
jgi:hypothetical protein